MTFKELEKLVYDFPTINVEGYTSQEKERFLNRYFPMITLNTLNETIGVATCIMRDNELIIYHIDIYYALRKLILNQPMNSAEFD